MNTFHQSISRSLLFPPHTSDCDTYNYPLFIPPLSTSKPLVAHLSIIFFILSAILISNFSFSFSFSELAHLFCFIFVSNIQTYCIRSFYFLFYISIDVCTKLYMKIFFFLSFIVHLHSIDKCRINQWIFFSFVLFLA